MPSELNIVNEHLHFPKVTLTEPSPSMFIHIAAEIESRLPIFPGSRTKKDLIAQCKVWCDQLEKEPGVIDASVFNVLLIPPGRGEFIKQRPGKVHIARFDLAILIECENKEAIERVRRNTVYEEMEKAIQEAASYVHTITATNVRRIGPVDHSRQGVFLFNYFFADDVDQNLGIWKYTAGWFQSETGLDNSTVLLPVDASQSKYSIINHCRWDKLSDILPSLIFKRSFHSYVLDNFEANNVAALPILYRLA
jgi:hypothetical protein